MHTPSPLSSYVLHHYDWSETSLILDVFTREQGRLTLVAKGAKRPYSQLRAVLLPFQRIHVLLGRALKSNNQLEESGNDIQNLRKAEWAGGSAMLTGAALFSGFYLNELLMKFIARHDAYPVLFDAYAQTLPHLAKQDDVQVQSALRSFELLLLKEVGVLPDLSLVTSTQTPVHEQHGYTLTPESGISVSRHNDVEINGAFWIALQAALAQGYLTALHQVCTQALPELKILLRNMLHYHLGSPLLHTRQMMIEMQNLQPQL